MKHAVESLSFAALRALPFHALVSPAVEGFRGVLKVVGERLQLCLGVVVAEMLGEHVARWVK